MLFNFYIKLLGELIHGFKLVCYQHADNTHHYISLSKLPRSAIEILTNCLTTVVK